jgi:hypothetical protein
MKIRAVRQTGISVGLGQLAGLRRVRLLVLTAASVDLGSERSFAAAAQKKAFNDRHAD